MPLVELAVTTPQLPQKYEPVFSEEISMINQSKIVRRLAILPLLGTAAALSLFVRSVAQAQPTAATATPPAGLGVALEEGPNGIMIAGVSPGGTAAAIGVRPRDILLQVGGKPVTGAQVVSQYVQSLQVGDPRAPRDLERSGEPRSARRCNAGVRRVEHGRCDAPPALRACGRGIQRQDLGARRLSARAAPVQPRPDLRSGHEPLVARPAPAPADPPHHVAASAASST
jgi:hypothetical protein